MKKFLLKLGAFAVISMICGWSLQAMAVSEADLSMDDAYENDCFTQEEINKGYVTTFIEEPIVMETQGSTGGVGDKYVSRLCYRNTISYEIDEEPEMDSILSSICSENIKSPSYSTAEIEEFKISASCKPIQVILSKGGTGMIEGYIGMMYKWGVGIVGIIAVLVITISGIQISVAGGESGTIDEAKKRITKSLVGIAVLLLSSLILYTINPNFFTTK